MMQTGVALSVDFVCLSSYQNPGNFLTALTLICDAFLTSFFYKIDVCAVAIPTSNALYQHVSKFF